MSVLSFCVQISPIPPLLLLPLARQAVIGVLQLITLRTSELERLVTRLEKGKNGERAEACDIGASVTERLSAEDKTEP